MEISSHYYAVLSLCFALGYKKESAIEIAHASQFVDDAQINSIYLRADPGSKIRCTRKYGKAYFFDMATCHTYSKIKTFNWHSMVGNTAAFHFMPSIQGKSFTKKMRCKEKSPIMDVILKQAIKDKNPVKLGIVLHALADIYSHQGFSGILSNENDINDLKYERGTFNILTDLFRRLAGFIISDRMFDRLAPAYGHTQALTLPDIPFQNWSYTYDRSDSFDGDIAESGPISNRERYRRAFERIAVVLKDFLKAHKVHGKFEQFALKEEFFSILGEKCSDRCKVKKWQKFISGNGWLKDDDPGLTYDKNKWIREAFADYSRKKYSDRVVYDSILSDSFTKSSWYSYYLAVMWYKDLFFKTAKSKGLDIPV